MSQMKRGLVRACSNTPPLPGHAVGHDFVVRLFFPHRGDKRPGPEESDGFSGREGRVRRNRKKNRQRKRERQGACDGAGSLPGGPEDGEEEVSDNSSGDQQRCHHTTAETPLANFPLKDWLRPLGSPSLCAAVDFQLGRRV